MATIDIDARLEAAISAADNLQHGALDDIDPADVARFVAARLNESEPKAKVQVRTFVKRFGRTTGVNLLREVLAIEALGGEMTHEEPPRSTQSWGSVFQAGQQAVGNPSEAAQAREATAAYARAAAGQAGATERHRQATLTPASTATSEPEASKQVSSWRTGRALAVQGAPRRGASRWGYSSPDAQSGDRCASKGATVNPALRFNLLRPRLLPIDFSAVPNPMDNELAVCTFEGEQHAPIANTLPVHTGLAPHANHVAYSAGSKPVNRLENSAADNVVKSIQVPLSCVGNTDDPDHKSSLRCLAYSCNVGMGLPARIDSRVCSTACKSASVNGSSSTGALASVRVTGSICSAGGISKVCARPVGLQQYPEYTHRNPGNFDKSPLVVPSKGETPGGESERLSAANRAETMPKKRTGKPASGKGAKAKPPIDLKLVFGDPNTTEPSAPPSGMLDWSADATEQGSERISWLSEERPLSKSRVEEIKATATPHVAAFLLGPNPFGRAPTDRERLELIASECNRLLQGSAEQDPQFRRTLDSIDAQLHLLRKGITADPDASRALENVKSLRELAGSLDEYPDIDWAETRATLRRVADAYVAMPRNVRDRDARIRNHIYESCQWVLTMISDERCASLRESHEPSLGVSMIVSMAVTRIRYFLNPSEAQRLDANYGAVERYIRACCELVPNGKDSPANRALENLFSAMDMCQTARQFFANKRRPKRST